MNLIVEKIIHRLCSSHEPFFFSCGLQCNLVYTPTTLFASDVLPCAISYRTGIYLSAACLFKVAPTLPDCIPWKHTSQFQTGFFWVLDGCKAHSVCGNTSPQVLAATAQLAELHRLCSQNLTQTPLLSVMVTTALMLRATECRKELHRPSPCSWHRHWADTEQMGNGKSWLQQCPYCEEIRLLTRPPEIHGLLKFY